MKKLLLSIALLTSILSSFAQTPQVPNGDFENWKESSCNGEVPTGYSRISDLAEESYPCPSSTGISKSTNKYSGSYAVQITAQTYLGLSLANGIILSSAFNGRPTKLVGYTKFTKGGTDTLGIFVGIGDINDDEVAYGEVTITETQSDYVKFEITLDYEATNMQDPVFLGIGFNIGQSTDKTGFASASTSVLIDDLSFEYGPTTATTNYTTVSPINVYAANKNINFSENVSDVHVVDMVGAQKIQETTNTKIVNAGSLTTGMYIVTYKYNDAYFSKKVVIE